MATAFIISFLIYYIVLNAVLIAMIRPKFIFKKAKKTTVQAKSIALAVLFITSFWLGSLSYSLNLFNSFILD